MSQKQGTNKDANVPSFPTIVSPPIFFGQVPPRPKWWQKPLFYPSSLSATIPITLWQPAPKRLFRAWFVLLAPKWAELVVVVKWGEVKIGWARLPKQTMGKTSFLFTDLWLNGRITAPVTILQCKIVIFLCRFMCLERSRCDWYYSRRRCSRATCGSMQYQVCWSDRTGNSFLSRFDFYLNFRNFDFVFSGCSFEGLLSSCEMTIGGIPVQASARINHCHKPIDVTFLLQSSMDHNKTVIFSWLTI